MSTRQFPIPTLGALGLTLAAACDEKADDTASPFASNALAGDWEMTLWEGDLVSDLNFTYDYGDCAYTYAVSITMTVAASLTTTYDGTLVYSYDYSDTCYDYSYTDTYTYALTIVGSGRSYEIRSDDGYVELECQLDGDTLACHETGYPEWESTFER